MIRAFAGAVVGVAVAVGLIAATNRVLAQIISPMQAIEHWVVYLSVVLGAGFGAVAAGLSRPQQKGAGDGVEHGVQEERAG